MAEGHSRRELLTGAVSAAAVAQSSVAQTPAWNPPLVLFSRHLQWTGVDDGIAFSKQAGFAGIGWAVRPGAHIEPANVRRDLPRVVELTRNAGLSAPILTTAILDDTSPYTEAILETMKGVGITSYRAAVFRWDYKRDFGLQMDDMKTRIARLGKLNEKYGVTALYHTHAYPGLVGGAVWDLWMMVRDMDPRSVAINYDIGHATVRGGPGWFDTVHAAHKHIQGITLKDFQWVHFPARPFNNRWSPKYCRPGDGIVDFQGFFAYMKRVDFRQPIELYFEYEVPGPNQTVVNLLGSDFGKWKLEIPREEFLELMKRDLAFYRDIIRQT